MGRPYTDAELSMSDEKEEAFSWADSESVIVKPTQGVALYTNSHGDIVIRQQRDECGELTATRLSSFPVIG